MYFKHETTEKKQTPEMPHMRLDMERAHISNDMAQWKWHMECGEKYRRNLYASLIFFSFYFSGCCFAV